MAAPITELSAAVDAHRRAAEAVQQAGAEVAAQREAGDTGQATAPVPELQQPSTTEPA